MPQVCALESLIWGTKRLAGSIPIRCPITGRFPIDISFRYISTRCMRRGSRNQKTRFAVLGMLTIQPMSGYDIRKTVEASIVHFWNESYGQIYPMLKQLARDGLIAPRTGGDASRNRQEYVITAKGRAALEAWLSAAPGRQLVRNELLLKLFFAGNAPLECSLRHVEKFRAAEAAELQHFRRMERALVLEHSTHPSLPYWLITLRFGISHCAAGIRWAEDTLRELKRSARRKRKAVRS